MFVTAEATVSRLRHKSRWSVWELLMSISNFSLEFFNAPIIEVTPMARVVHDARISAGLFGSGSGILNLGDLDRSSSLSSRSVGDLVASSWWGVAWSPFSDSASIAAACPPIGGFSFMGNSAAVDALAMKLSRRRLRAWCTRWERPGPRYSLGILCIPTLQSNLHWRCNQKQQIHHSKTKHKLIFSYPKVCDAHLNRWFTLPIEITLTITPRCVPHILTGNVQSTKLQCLRQKQKIMQTDANMQKTQSQPTVNACTTLHMTAKQITVVSRAFETHRHVMQKKWNQCKTHDSWHQKTAQTRSHKSKFCPVRSRPNSAISKVDNKRVIKNFQDISKLRIHSSWSSTAPCTAFYAFLQLIVVLARA